MAEHKQKSQRVCTTQMLTCASSQSILALFAVFSCHKQSSVGVPPQGDGL
jgi:hypothetical protein